MAGIPRHHVTPRGAVWYQDANTGDLTTAKRWDEDLVYTFEMAADMESGESLGAVTMVDVSGPTFVASSVSGTVLTLRVTGAGRAVAQMTTTGGAVDRTIELPLVWRCKDRTVRDAYAY